MKLYDKDAHSLSIDYAADEGEKIYVNNTGQTNANNFGLTY